MFQNYIELHRKTHKKRHCNNISRTWFIYNSSVICVELIVKMCTKMYTNNY